jgi:hypothetical protein
MANMIICGKIIDLLAKGDKPTLELKLLQKSLIFKGNR